MGLALLTGQLSGIYTQLGVDTAAHIAEEVKGTLELPFILHKELTGPQTPPRLSRAL